MDSDIMEDSVFDDFDNDSDGYSPEVVRFPCTSPFQHLDVLP